MNNEFKNAFEDNVYLQFLVKDNTYGVVENALESVNFAGFTKPYTNTICVNIRDENYSIEEIVYLMKERYRQRGIHINIELIPCVVGRDKWKIGFVIRAKQSYFLLETLNNEDSLKFLEYMKNYNIEIKVIPINKKVGVKIPKESMKYFQKVGNKIKMEEAIQNVDRANLEILK